MTGECITTLDKVSINKTCRVVSIENSVNTVKLMNLGVVNESEITPLFISPFGGIVAYCIKGSVIAVRNEDAQKITVKV